MKRMCYPYYSFILFFALSIILMIFSFIPFFVFDGDGRIFIKLIWVLLMVVFSIIMLFAGLSFMQFCKLENNRIVLYNVFGKMEEILFVNLVLELSTMPTYYSCVCSFEKKWICLYDKMKGAEHFINGFSNKKRKGRIQIIYTEKTYNDLIEILEKSKKGNSAAI